MWYNIIMFGFKKKTTDQDTQIPYQVYETVHEPAARRKRWIIRLLIGLVVATVLVVIFVFIRNRLGNESKSAQPTSPQGQQVQQAPQTNAPLPQPEGQPAKTPLSDSTNDKTVDQPQ